MKSDCCKSGVECRETGGVTTRFICRVCGKDCGLDAEEHGEFCAGALLLGSVFIAGVLAGWGLRWLLI